MRSSRQGNEVTTARKAAGGAKTLSTKSKNTVSAKSLRDLRIKRPTAGAEGNSLVREAVDALRRRILASPEIDRFLGSEEQLLTALGISRPTFRQAARLLEHEQLLKIKRGIGGGFFAQPPSADAVTRLASIFLSSQGTTLLQLHDASAPMMIEAARLVAGNPSVSIRRRLLDFLKTHASAEPGADAKTRLRMVLEFEQMVGKLSGNSAVELMLSVMRDLVRDPRYGDFRVNEERLAAYADFSQRLAQAVADGDVDMAVLITTRHTREVRSWLANGKDGDA